MDKAAALQQLKAALLRDVSYLCRRADVKWSEPISRTLRDIREMQAHAVFFGGTLRSLLLSRLQERRLGRPRDVDLVIAGARVEDLRDRFRRILKRETRFGGLQLQRMNWHFDVWPLEQTWAFLQDSSEHPRFAALPSTTFFNLEAIAVDVWPSPGRRRNVYAGNDQFFEGVLSRTIEINREDNPFPALCVVRALVMASAIDFAIGPRLASYLTRHGPRTSDSELEAVQLRHYGQVRRDSRTLRAWLRRVAEMHAADNTSPIRLPLPRQMSLWPEDDENRMWLNVCVLTETARSPGPQSGARNLFSQAPGRAHQRADGRPTGRMTH